MRRLTVLMLCWIALTGAAAAGERPRILAIGDSVMSWQKWVGRDIPHMIERLIDHPVDSEAVPGARFSNRSDLGEALGFDIRAQYDGGAWDIVLLNGGANDFLGECGCGACGPVLDQLIAPDLTGEVPAFIASLRETGAKVIWMGYYKSFRDGQFSGCRPTIVEMEKRIARLAERERGVLFVDSEDVIDARQRNLFAFDGIHPSARGTARIGAYLAPVIERLSADMGLPIAGE